MWFVLALFSSLTFGLAGFMMKASSAQRGQADWLLWGLYFTGTLGFLGWMILTGDFQLSLEALVAGLIVGFGSAAGNALFMRALEKGPASLTSPVVNLNTALTVGMSMLVYGERLSWSEALGILLLIAAVTLLPVDPDESLRIRNPRWYALVLSATLLFFLRNGGLKITGELGMDNTAVLFVSYLYGLAWFTWRIFRRRTISADPAARRTGLGWGLASGIFSFAGMQIYALALKSGPASIVAPIFSTNSLVVAVLSVWIFRERLSKMQMFCLLLLFSGLILIRSG
jgi:drug/metabolite transporter (DMT)-like permease